MNIHEFSSETNGEFTTNKLMQPIRESKVDCGGPKPFQREYQEKPAAGMAEGNAEKETSSSQTAVAEVPPPRRLTVTRSWVFVHTSVNGCRGQKLSD